MHRFYLPPSECVGNRFPLTGREAHHAISVLRLRERDRVTVLDGAGHEIMCEVEAAGKQTLDLKVVQRNLIPALPYQLTLVQAVPKGKVMEAIIQKATELGVTRIVPLLSDRVVTQLDQEDVAGRQQRWQQVAVESIKQCGQPWLPLVDTPLTPKAYLDRNEKFDLHLIASLQEGSQHPREFFADYRAERKSLPKSLAVWIGPEGDFTPAEMNAACSGGARPITLGRLVLRSETAAIYSLSVLNYEMQAGYSNEPSR
jgi:16S rRNA (uracil1498-N3)-methyltransferase